MTEKEEQIGTASVQYMGKALFFCMEGGTFTGEGIEGSFATTEAARRSSSTSATSPTSA